MKYSSYVPTPEFGYIVEVNHDKGFGKIKAKRGDLVCFHLEGLSKPVKVDNIMTFVVSDEPFIPVVGMDVIYIAGQRPTDRIPQAECWMPVTAWLEAFRPVKPAVKQIVPTVPAQVLPEKQNNTGRDRRVFKTKRQREAEVPQAKIVSFQKQASDFETRISEAAVEQIAAS